MKVENMRSSNGNKIADQFVITDHDRQTGNIVRYFQSYNSVIAEVRHDGETLLDTYTWDYSVTTSKYRNQFLGESKKETQAKIDSGEYLLADLNE